MVEASGDLELREAFNLFDADGDGQVIWIFVIYNTIFEILKKITFNIYKIFCKKAVIINFYFVQITMAELENLFAKLCTDNRIKQSEVHALLKVADKDKSGTITFDVSFYISPMKVFKC